MGAWIEISMFSGLKDGIVVAPLVGAWIEIKHTTFYAKVQESLLSWERGLKFYDKQVVVKRYSSLLSWERGLKFYDKQVVVKRYCRSSRGSVD